MITKTDYLIARDNVELYEFYNNVNPKTWVIVNLDKRIVTTSLGTKLGDLFTGKTVKDKYGNTRMSIKVYGINDLRYFGTYYKSSGEYAKIQLYKGELNK